MLRAAAGPLLRRAQHLDVAVRPAKSSGSMGVDEPSSTTMTRMPRSAAPGVEAKSVVAHRNYDGDVTVRRATRWARVGHGRVEQGAGQLGAHGVVDLEAAVGEHVLRGRRQAQQPGG